MPTTSEFACGVKLSSPVNAEGQLCWEGPLWIWTYAHNWSKRAISPHPS